jgi:hypothetical protein
MSMKKFSLIALTLLGSLGAYAQDTSTTGSSGDAAADYAPAAGDFSASLLLGRGNFMNSGLDAAVPGVPTSSWQVPGSAPVNNTVDANSNDVTNMVGVEVRYYLMDDLAVKLSGGAIIRNTPAQTNVPGFINSGDNKAAWIPAYASVKADNRVETNVNVGAEKIFTTKYNRVFPYVGVTIPFYYSRQSFYDPTIIDTDPNSSSPSDPDVVDLGVRSAEIVGFGGQIVGGFDFYLFEGMYMGFEIKPVSVVYAYMVKSPGSGLPAGEAQNTTYTFFSQPFLKIGFRF